MTFLNRFNIYSVYIVSKYIVYSDSFPINLAPIVIYSIPLVLFHSFKDALIRSNLISIYAVKNKVEIRTVITVVSET